MKKEKLFKVKVAYIDGYWHDTKEKLDGYKIAIAPVSTCDALRETGFDDTVFYWFEPKEKVKGKQDEFTITRVYDRETVTISHEEVK